MEKLLDTAELERHIKLVYSKVIPIMKKDNILVPLNTIFRENTSFDFQGEFCFTDKNGYHFRITERNRIYRDDTTQNLFDITYWTINGEISEAAAIYESKNRIDNQDFRRIMFSKEIQYFEAIGDEYAQRARLEIESILKKAPFQDELFQ